MEQINKTLFYKKHLLTKIIIISLIVGLLAGAVGGILTFNLSAGRIFPWFKQHFLAKIDGWQNTESSGSVLQQQDSKLNKEQNKLELPASKIINNEQATINAVKQTSPSVVSIIISKDLSKYYNATGSNIFSFDDIFDFGSPFNFQFNDLEQQQPKSDKETEQKQVVGGGSGFIVSSDGLILTNKHVVSDPDADYAVVMNDGQKYPAKILAKDPFNDVAIIKIEVNNLQPIVLGDSDKINIGQTVIAIGNSLGEYRNTVTKGVVSGIGRQITAGDGLGSSEVLEGVIQTDAAINPGNSGGPLINLFGKVIGVNTAISRSGQLIGFAIPINSVKQTIKSVKENGRIIRPFLGLRYLIINKQIAKDNNLTVDHGALIVRGDKATDLAITPDGPANKAGLVENDIILEINGQALNQQHYLGKEISKYQPGTEITLKILHQGKEKTVKVVLAEYPIQ